jgi:hypothetical protein
VNTTVKGFREFGSGLRANTIRFDMGLESESMMDGDRNIDDDKID